MKKAKSRRAKPAVRASKAKESQFIDSRTAVGLFVILAVAALLMWSYFLSAPKSMSQGAASTVASNDYSTQAVRTIVRVNSPPESIKTTVQVVGEATPTDLPPLPDSADNP